MQKIHLENKRKEQFTKQERTGDNPFFNLTVCSHLRQLWDLNQPFKILQITGAIE